MSKTNASLMKRARSRGQPAPPLFYSRRRVCRYFDVVSGPREPFKDARLDHGSDSPASQVARRIRSDVRRSLSPLFFPARLLHPRMPTTRSTRASTAASTGMDGKSVSPTKSSPRKTSPKRKLVKDEEEPKSPPEKKPKIKEVKEGSPKGKMSTNRTGGSEGPNAKPGEMPSDRFLSSMGTKDNLERKHGLLESGEIYFIYRPRVMIEEAASLGDVAR